MKEVGLSPRQARKKASLAPLMLSEDYPLWMVGNNGSLSHGARIGAHEPRTQTQILRLSSQASLPAAGAGLLEKHQHVAIDMR